MAGQDKAAIQLASANLRTAMRAVPSYDPVYRTKRAYEDALEAADKRLRPPGVAMTYEL